MAVRERLPKLGVRANPSCTTATRCSECHTKVSPHDLFCRACGEVFIGTMNGPIPDFLREATKGKAS